jgi:hypothetical protein
MPINLSHSEPAANVPVPEVGSLGYDAWTTVFQSLRGSNRISGLRRCQALFFEFPPILYLEHRHGANFFFVAQGRLCTAMERNVLAGITRENLMRLARDLGLPVVERNFTVFDVATGDEAFSTTTPHDIVRVARVNGYQIGARTVPGPITVEIIKAFNDLSAWISWSRPAATCRPRSRKSNYRRPHRSVHAGSQPDSACDLSCWKDCPRSGDWSRKQVPASITAALAWRFPRGFFASPLG